MRISSLIRACSMRVPLSRAGVPPTWDRPDPPPNQVMPISRRQTFQESAFTWFDQSSPTYHLHNPEVYLGDLIEATPVVAKSWAFFFASAIFIGTLGFLFNPLLSQHLPSDIDNQLEKMASHKQAIDDKLLLKSLLKNPWKLNVWPEHYPHLNYSLNCYYESFERRANVINLVQQVNAEGLSYWNKLKEDAEKSLAAGSTSPHH